MSPALTNRSLIITGITPCVGERRRPVQMTTTFHTDGSGRTCKALFLHALRFLVPLVVLVCALPPQARADSPRLDAGFRQMYNLDFPGAHRTFTSWQQTHPGDPFGHMANAAAYLFSEFDRLHILESELFTDDTRFEHRAKPVADPAIRSAFMNELAKAESLAQQVLSRSPNDRNALLAQVLVNGLRADYLSLIEKRNLASLGYIKTARSLAEKLLAQDPSCYDAYLALGVENYLLGVNPAPVRWFLRLGGAQTDKDVGIEKLRITATKGQYLAPFARLLLAVAALRDKKPDEARTLLQGLAKEFPQNHLYTEELARIEKYPR